MVNGISVNGLGEVAMDASQTASNLIGLGKQLSHDLILGRNVPLSLILYTDGNSINSEMMYTIFLMPSGLYSHVLVS
jgi:hypothetical protein